ncbi:MAG: DUF1698 domain-containing protein [Acidimicrobiia bacterium]|nr:DUF1698 domain-containing protein [Acidimicrobiia bacterium]
MHQPLGSGAGSFEPTADWSHDRVRRAVEGRDWFHTFDFGRGVRTAGYDDTLAKLGHLHLPSDMTGRTVLDVGTYDGFFAFECERRGAEDVLATDSWTWNWPGSSARANFDLVRDILGSQVRSQVISVEELAPDIVGSFDIVLFLGVLYHAPDPLGYLRRVRSVTREMLVLETVVDLLDVEVPAVAYYPGASLNGDASNHFGPNRAALAGLLADAGFSRVECFRPWTVNGEYALAPKPLGHAQGSEATGADMSDDTTADDADGAAAEGQAAGTEAGGPPAAGPGGRGAAGLVASAREAGLGGTARRAGARLRRWRHGPRSGRMVVHAWV